MTETAPPLTDPVALGRILADVAAQAQPLMQEFWARWKPAAPDDRLGLWPAYVEFLEKLWSDPERLAETQMRFWQDWTKLCQAIAEQASGGPAPALYAPERNDRRFRADAWTENPLFDFFKQSYLLVGNWLEEVTQQTGGLSPATREKIEFFNRQWLNAAAPSNFLLTNPEVLQATLDSGGENLIRGLQNMIGDLERGHGSLRISTTDYKAFRLGENIAATPGKVVFETEMMQLIQYAPATETVFERPLLIVPPWINKYYILDLKPSNSMIRWLVEKGHTVFVISWVNPGRAQAHKMFDDYLSDGVLTALAQVEKITGVKGCNVAGYCLGGTLLSMALAWLQAKGQADRVASATFLTAMIDFDLAGDMKLFIDEAQLERLDREMQERGLLPADFLRETFSLLRSNDLIWSFVINNYLLGKEPFPFDLLYWNDDATNMPAAMHSFYLRKCYLENVLCRPGGVAIAGVPIDVSTIKTPAYFLSTREDHIAPWKATYAGTQLLAGPVTFTLAASGHVAGVVNPPDNRKYNFWTAEKTPPDPEEWLRRAKPQDGSWWTHWEHWLRQQAGAQVPARALGAGIENAPGRYVAMPSEI